MASGEPSLAEVCKTLQNVRILRLCFCDVAGIRRLRAVRLPADNDARTRFLQDLTQTGIGMCVACIALPAYGDVAVPGTGLDAVGEIRLCPDWPSLRCLPWKAGHAMVQLVMRNIDGGTWDMCPRSALKRAAGELAKHGLRMECGFESEFILYRKDSKGKRVPVDKSVYCQETAFEDMADILDEMTSCLEEMDIGIVQFHGESSPGQYEIVTRHCDALQAVDKLLETRAAIYGVAKKHGLIPSFLPKVDNKVAGSGCHMHFSLLEISTGKNLFESVSNLSKVDTAKPTFPAQLEQFIAGVLRALPAVMMLTVPSPNSFRRLVPSCWAGCFTIWGVQNREAPLRLTLMPTNEAGSFKTTNMELKLFDGTAQPHLGVAAVISAGLYGMAKALSLPNPVQIDPVDLSAEQAAAEGVFRLPTSISAAIDGLSSVPGYSMMTEVMGKDLLNVVMVVRKAEYDFFVNKELEEEAEILLEIY